jgi:hypothetical protein
MKHLNSFKNFNEALKPSQFREYVKEFDRERYLDIFKKLGDKYEHDKNYYRIYIPLVKEEIKGYVSKIHEEIDKFLKENDCQIVDYVKGSAKFNNSKNETTIGKLLTRFKNEDLNKKFVEDEKRKALTSTSKEDLLVVISRHPYDITGSDTDRNWTNCMTIGTDKSNRLTKLMDELESAKKSNDDKKIREINDKIMKYKSDGVNVKYLIKEVQEGSLISYLINKNDKNINNPLGVLNIKPYHPTLYTVKDRSGKVVATHKEISPEMERKYEEEGLYIEDGLDRDITNLYTSKHMYGVNRSEFKKTVDNILNEYFNKSIGTFCLNNRVYNDQEDKYVVDLDEKDLGIDGICSELGIKNYKINSDGTVDVDGTVNISNNGLKKIPLKFGKVSGSFDCSFNILTSLEGSPRSIGGNFNCDRNRIKSLKEGPKEVKGYYWAGSCNDDNPLNKDDYEWAKKNFKYGFVPGIRRI